MSNIPAEYLPAIREQAKRVLAQRDFSYFMQYDKEMDGLKDVPGKHLALLDSLLQQVSEGNLRRLIVTMPPRHGKSERVSKKFPAWYLGNHPQDEIIIASYSLDLARDFSRIARDTFMRHKDTFGVDVDSKYQSAESWGVQGHRGRLTAAGVGTGITGRGASVAVVDDALRNFQDAQSDVIRETLWNWYKSTLYTRLTPSGAIVVVSTRWHEDDLIGRLLAEEKMQLEDGTHVGERWTVINLPAIAEEDNDRIGRFVGQALWPEYGFGKEQLEKIKSDVGSFMFAALYQQRPAPAEGNMLKRDWWQYYEGLPPIASMLISVDAAFKDSDTSDFVVVQVWGKTGPNMYLIDQVRGRMNFLATCQAIRNMATKYPNAYVKLIEDKANGSAIIQTLSKEMGGVIGVNPEGGKVTRVNAVSAAIESGNVYLPRTSWVQDFVEECASFPSGKFDDQVDAMSQALHRFIYFAAKIKEVKTVDMTMEARIRRNMASGGKKKTKEARLL